MFVCNTFDFESHSHTHSQVESSQIQKETAATLQNRREEEIQRSVVQFVWCGVRARIHAQMRIHTIHILYCPCFEHRFDLWHQMTQYCVCASGRTVYRRRKLFSIQIVLLIY